MRMRTVSVMAIIEVDGDCYHVTPEDHQDLQRLFNELRRLEKVAAKNSGHGRLRLDEELGTLVDLTIRMHELEIDAILANYEVAK